MWIYSPDRTSDFTLGLKQFNDLVAQVRVFGCRSTFIIQIVLNILLRVIIYLKEFLQEQKLHSK